MFRCLEEGAEEFLLKPVRLSDVDRLKPHVLKQKSREQSPLQQIQEEEAQQQLEAEEVEQRKEVEGEQKQEVEQKIVLEESEQLSTQQANIKRKTMEEISPERTRTRYNELDNGLIKRL